MSRRPGCKVERGSPANTTVYAWDSRNRLTGISGPGLAASFSYGPLGRRTARIVNGQRVDYIYDGLQAVGEVTLGQLTTLLTGFGLDEVIARYSPAGARYYLTDALNTVIAQTRSDRSIQNVYVYSPYGQASSIGDDGGNPVQYTARENDGTGRDYYRARYYDPLASRFLAEDLERFTDGANLFAYVRGGRISWAGPPESCRAS